MADVTTLLRDGVTLAYEERGTGDPPLLFVHGWACDRTYFAPQVENFAREHRVVAVDLRGHGQSDAPPGEYSPAVFAADLAWLCERLGIQRPVVIGHSMGGVVAVALAALHPHLPTAIVAVDAAICPPTALRVGAEAF